MKLLLDENLSRHAVPFLQDAFPGSTQIALLGMENTDDRTIWRYTKDNDFMIVTKDADFFEMASVYGQPPQIVWLKNQFVGQRITEETRKENDPVAGSLGTLLGGFAANLMTKQTVRKDYFFSAPTTRPSEMNIFGRLGL